MNEDIIVVENLSKSFKETQVLKNVSFKLKKGTMCGLIGLNGSGKTVLMKTICGFLLPDAGFVEVRGKKIGADCDFPENLGIIIETPSFSPFVSGFKNLKNLAAIRGKISDNGIYKAMEEVGLEPRDKKWVSKYSLGMRQRLGIAQAIMEGQDILILDEPMNGLDKEGMSDVRKLLLELKNQGKTILLASHNMQDVEALCDRVFEIEHGILQEIIKE